MEPQTTCVHLSWSSHLLVPALELSRAEVGGSRRFSKALLLDPAFWKDTEMRCLR